MRIFKPTEKVNEFYHDSHAPIIWILHLLTLKKIFLMLFIFERERGTEHEWGRGRERESEAGSRLRAVSTDPDVGLQPTNREIVT